MSRYVSNPLLIGGKKFDLRVYVVVTRFRPLRAYISRLGFARFCNVKYSSAPDDLENPYVHLTNVAVQRKHREYNHKHGNKWSLANLRLYLDAARGAKATDAMFASINEATWVSKKKLMSKGGSLRSMTTSKLSRVSRVGAARL